MKFRFIGTYTNGHTSINAGGVIFYGNDPSDVEDTDLIERLTNNQEFEAVGKRDPLDHDGDGKKGGSVSGRTAEQSEALKVARAAYKKATGKNAFNGWDEATLREKMGA
jgi:hypothetical protein